MLPLLTVDEARVVADPELRYAPSGVAVCKMRLVASKRKQNDAGEWVDDKVFWITATCFKDLAEHVAESVKQGDLVTVVGRLQTDEWETEDGAKRSAPALIADSVGVSLKFRNIPHGAGRTERSTGGAASEDAWATPPARPASPSPTPPAQPAPSYDEPPF